jgi:hypothetical protein
MNVLERFNYKIDYSYKNRTDGTDEKPLLVGISSGNKTAESLNYHLQIGNAYHEMVTQKVNSKSVNLVCRDQYCKATTKLEIDPKFITKTPNFFKNGNKFRS